MLNSKITTILIEKSQNDLSELKKQLEPISELSIVAMATTGNQGISLIHDYAPQLVFVNTDLQDIDGLEFVKVLHNRNIFSEIVFVSDSDERAYEALPLEPLDLLVKPISNTTLTEMMQRLVAKFRKKDLLRKMDIYARENEVVAKRTFRHQKGIIILPLNEIVFCKAELTATKLTLYNNECILLKTGISQTIEIINSEDFIRISRSYCINRNYLRKIDKRNLKCLMYHEGNSWEVTASKNVIGQLEKLVVFPIS